MRNLKILTYLVSALVVGMLTATSITIQAATMDGGGQLVGTSLSPRTCEVVATTPPELFRSILTTKGMVYPLQE